jgi:hypothetical protein
MTAWGHFVSVPITGRRFFNGAGAALKMAFATLWNNWSVEGAFLLPLAGALKADSIQEVRSKREAGYLYFFISR